MWHRLQKNHPVLYEATADCAVRHINAFLGQARDKAVADFGAPCVGCSHVSECDFDWQARLQPLIDCSKETIHTGRPLKPSK